MTGPLGVDHTIRRGDVALERKRRILDDADVVAILLQEAVDRLPSRAIHETAVNKNHGSR
jgi:hypothetical protein